MDSGNQNDLTITFCTKQPDKNILVKMTRLIAKMIAFSRSFKSLQLLAHAPVNNGAGGKRSDKTPAAVAVNFKSRHGKQEYASAYMEIAGQKTQAASSHTPNNLGRFRRISTTVTITKR